MSKTLLQSNSSKDLGSLPREGLPLQAINDEIVLHINTMLRSCGVSPKSVLRLFFVTLLLWFCVRVPSVPIALPLSVESGKETLKKGREYGSFQGALKSWPLNFL